MSNVEFRGDPKTLTFSEESKTSCIFDDTRQPLAVLGRLASGPASGASGPSHHRAGFHHETDIVQGGDIGQRVARNSDLRPQ
jgi:hypothetical protein